MREGSLQLRKRRLNANPVRLDIALAESVHDGELPRFPVSGYLQPAVAASGSLGVPEQNGAGGYQQTIIDDAHHDAHRAPPLNPLDNRLILLRS